MIVTMNAGDADQADQMVDVSDWLCVQAGDWARAQVRPGADTGCETFQGTVQDVDDGWKPSVRVNDVRRYWANWQLIERRPAEA